MNNFSVLLLAGVLTLPIFAQDAAKPASPSAPVNSTPPAAPIILVASKAVVTAPLVSKDGALSQPQQTELADGGKATFQFSVSKAGTYEIYGDVNASAEDANSFYLNIDAPPEDPAMIWDIDVTSGFQERVVSWRGKGDVDSDEFKPKRFSLTAGTHKLFLVGREPAELRSLSIRLVAN